MRINFEVFDCIWGILVGAILLGLSGLYFSLPNISLLWGVFFAVSAITTVVDVALCVKDFHDMHKIMLLGIVLSSIVYIVVEIGMVSKFFSITIPFITQSVVPILSQPMMLVYISAFFIVTSIIWLIDTLRSR
jgi:hypothetical protein